MTARRGPLVPTPEELAEMDWPDIVTLKTALSASDLWVAIHPYFAMNVKVHLLAVRGDAETLICTIQSLRKVGGYHIGRVGRQRMLFMPDHERAMNAAVAEMPAAFARL